MTRRNGAPELQGVPATRAGRKGTGGRRWRPAAAAALSLLLSAGSAAPQAQPLRLLFPVDGLVLSPGYDASPAPGLQVLAVGVAPPGWTVRVAGRRADPVPSSGLQAAGVSVRSAPPRLQVDTPLDSYDLDGAAWVPFTAVLDLDREVLDLEAVGTREHRVAMHTVVCYVRPSPVRTWAITVDDAADVLAQLAREPGRYASLFDHPTLSFLRQLHRRWGAVVSLYLLRQGITSASFALEDMPARYRAEWQASADWLRLGFHGAAMEPAEPYARASGEQAMADLLAVRRQVYRFAGEAVWDRFLRSHYWSGSQEACRAWQQAGILGFYAAVAGRLSYYLGAQQSRVVSRCDWWRDHAENHLFVQTDVWVERDFLDPLSANTTSAARVPALLDSLARRPWGAQVMQVFTHESLLLPHAARWAVPERLDEAAAWLSRQGYVPRFDADDGFALRLPPVPPSAVRLEEGPGSALSWSHGQRGCTYVVVRKDLATPTGPWLQVGTTPERRFTDAARAGTYAYRVAAIDAAGRRSGGSEPLRVRVLRNPDLDRDGRVSLDDFFALADHLAGPAQAGGAARLAVGTGDLNADGQVDLQDFRDFAALFGRTVGPEPLVATDASRSIDR